MLQDIDYITNEAGDLIIENGDFKKGNATSQHIRNILQAAPGHYRQYPVIGADINQVVNIGLDDSIKKQIRYHLKLDGYEVKDIKEVNGEIVIDANRL